MARSTDLEHLPAQSSREEEREKVEDDDGDLCGVARRPDRGCSEDVDASAGADNESLVGRTGEAGVRELVNGPSSGKDMGSEGVEGKF